MELDAIDTNDDAERNSTEHVTEHVIITLCERRKEGNEGNVNSGNKKAAKEKRKKGRGQGEEEEGEGKKGGFMVYVTKINVDGHGMFLSLSSPDSASSTPSAPSAPSPSTSSVTVTKSPRQIPGSQIYCLHGISSPGPSSSSLTFRITSTGATRTFLWTPRDLLVTAKSTFKGRVNEVLDYGGSRPFVVSSGKGGRHLTVTSPPGTVSRTLGRGKVGTTAIGGEGDYLLAGDVRGRITVYKEVTKLLEHGHVNKDVCHWHSQGVKAIRGLTRRSWCSVGGENVYVEWEVGCERPVHFVPRAAGG
ncbi:hypothetical protein TrRE_jg10790, partial [Triparma retinervis]